MKKYGQLYGYGEQGNIRLRLGVTKFTMDSSLFQSIPVYSILLDSANGDLTKPEWGLAILPDVCYHIHRQRKGRTDALPNTLYSHHTQFSSAVVFKSYYTIIHVV